MKKLKIVFVLLISANLITAQNIEWSKMYGGFNQEISQSIQQTADGGYIVAGWTQSDDGDVHGFHGDFDYWLLKLNSTGDTIWTRCYGGSDWEQAYSVQQTNDNGYIVAGYSNSNDGDVSGNNDYEDYWILKLDEYGDTIWTKCYGGSDHDYAHSIQQTTDSGYIVAGHSNSIDGDVNGNHGDYDYWILKLDKFGSKIWAKCYGGSQSDYAYSIQQTTDSGYIVGGYSESNDGDVNGNKGGYDYWILKLDKNGDTLWTKSYGGSNAEYTRSIKQTTDGGYIIAGSSLSNDWDVSGNHGNADYWILKLDVDGDTVWTNCYGGSDYDYVDPIQQTTNGGYIVAGNSYSIDGDVNGNKGGQDIWVIELDQNGDTVWTKNYGGSGEELVRSIQQTTDGGYIISGSSNSVDGDVNGGHFGPDYWILKINNIANLSFNPQYLEIIRIYPNPTTGIINIDSEKNLKIEVLNLLGEIIIESYDKEINISNQSAGVYFIRITKGEETITRKIIKK